MKPPRAGRRARSRAPWCHPKTRTGVWSQESVMMTVATSLKGLDPVQELTQVMNSCATWAWGQRNCLKENLYEASPHETPRP
jgi:hypothetical protein